MPKIKQFEYMELEIPFQVKKMNMYEMLEDRYKLITKLFDMIEELKGNKNDIAIVEVPKDDTHYGIWKEYENFIIFDPNNNAKSEYEPIDFFNWCMEKSPFMSVVGKGSHKH